MVPLLFVQDTVPRLVIGLTAGGAVAPTIILAMTLVENLTPPGLLTTAMGWAGSAMITGNAAGQVLAGHAADRQNGHVGCAVTLTGGVFGLITALSRSRFRVNQAHSVQEAGAGSE